MKLAVILCTYNPRPDLIAWALKSVDGQSLARSEFEFLIVDNNSYPALDASALQAAVSVPCRVLVEPQQGLTYARLAGIRATTAPLIVFIDDDNYLDPDYLEQALKIATAQPWIGCFGGKARAVLEAPLPAWKNGLLSYLGVRDYGPHAITSTKNCWGEWEPIGAGMVCRRDVTEKFGEWVESIPAAVRLGRSGRAMMSGEDTLLAQAAYKLGYACSYQPSLALSHWMKSSRLSGYVLARTMAGHGRSHVVLQALKGEPIPRPSLMRVAERLFSAYRKHVRRNGFEAGTVRWFWDLGYFQEARKAG